MMECDERMLTLAYSDMWCIAQYVESLYSKEELENLDVYKELIAMIKEGKHTFKENERDYSFVLDLVCAVKSFSMCKGNKWQIICYCRAINQIRMLAGFFDVNDLLILNLKKSGE